MRLLTAALLLVICTLFMTAPLIASESGAQEWRSRESSKDRDLYSESDTDEEQTFGREIAARLLGQHNLLINSSLQKYVNLVGTVLAQNSSRPDLEFHFVVIQSSEINAYSTPGGYVFITTAILEKMENEAELAGVLAHEITHVAERHIVKELHLKGTEKSAVSSLSTLIGGASESLGVAFSQAVDKAVDIILRDGYKQEDEIQADIGAVSLCASAGYDPSALITFLDKIGKIKTGIGKTYPVYDVRLATLQKTITEEGASGLGLALNRDRFNRNFQNKNQNKRIVTP